jgi:hypothetical protein
VTKRALLLASVALATAAVDLAVKAGMPATDFHERSGLYVAAAACSIPWAVTLLATGSRLVAAAGGVLLGGALANLASLGLWADGVPNPLVAGPYAFNPADAFALLGGLVLVPAAVAVYAARNRGRLREPVRLS